MNLRQLVDEVLLHPEVPEEAMYTECEKLGCTLTFNGNNLEDSFKSIKKGGNFNVEEYYTVESPEGEKIEFTVYTAIDN